MDDPKHSWLSGERLVFGVPLNLVVFTVLAPILWVPVLVASVGAPLYVTMLTGLLLYSAVGFGFRLGQYHVRRATPVQGDDGSA